MNFAILDLVLILDCDTVLGGMLEADICIQEEIQINENLENFRQLFSLTILSINQKFLLWLADDI